MITKPTERDYARDIAAAGKMIDESMPSAEEFAIGFAAASRVACNSLRSLQTLAEAFGRVSPADNCSAGDAND